MRRHLVPALLALTLPFALAACQGDDSKSGSGSGSGSGSDHDAEAWAPPTDVSTEPGPEGLTRPGATFDLGDEAQLQYIDDGFGDDLPVDTTLTVTATAAPEVAAEGDVPEQFAERAEGRTIYLVRLTATNTGPAGDGGNLLSPRVADADGDLMDSSATSEGDCVGTLPAPGQSGEVCAFAFGDDEAPVAVAYAQDDTAYDDDPVYWRLP